MQLINPDDNFLKIACNHLINKKFSLAFTTLLDCESLDMSEMFKPLALNILATFYYLIGNADRSLDLLDKVLILLPNDIDSTIKKCIIKMERTNEREIADLFDSLKSRSPHPDIFYHHGQIRFIANQFEDAVKEYKHAIEIEPDFMYAHIQLGVALYKSGKNSESETVFAEAARKFSKRGEIHHYHGEVYADKGDIENGKLNN